VNQKPSIGRIVHVVMPNGDHRPAIVTNVFGNLVNAHVFLDLANDRHNENVANLRNNCGADVEGTAACLYSISPDEDLKAPRTWHWPERE
jgi:hypothetical protein